MHLKNKVSLLLMQLFCSLLFVGAAVSAAAPVQRSTLEIKPPETNKLLPWVDLSLDYVVRTDLNQTVSPRAYDHSLDLSVSRSLNDKFDLILSGGIEYTTLSGDVYRGTSTDPYVSPRDLSLALSRTFKQGESHTFNTMIEEDVLTSDESRYFGYLSVTGVKVTHGYRLSKWLGVRQGLDLVYIWNRFRYAPVAAGNIEFGDINPDFLANYVVGPYVTLAKGLKVSLQFAVRSTRYLDNSYLYGFGNSYSLSYSNSGWTFWAKYLNRGYAERGETNLWFADEYRRLASAGVSVDF